MTCDYTVALLLALLLQAAVCLRDAPEAGRCQTSLKLWNAGLFAEAGRLSGGVPLRAISQTLVERRGAVSSSHQIIAPRILFLPSKHSGVGWQAPPDTRPSPLGSSFTRRRFNHFFCDWSCSDFLSLPLCLFPRGRSLCRLDKDAL